MSDDTPDAPVSYGAQVKLRYPAPVNLRADYKATVEALAKVLLEHGPGDEDLHTCLCNINIIWSSDHVARAVLHSGLVVPAADVAPLRERFALARDALLRDGYFTPDQVGEDIAPRIIERLDAAVAALAERDATIARLSDLLLDGAPPC